MTQATKGQKFNPKILLPAAGCLTVLAIFAGSQVKAYGDSDGVGVEAPLGSNITNSPDDIVRFVPDNLFAVDFVTAQLGWVAGYYGTLLKTEDAGLTWSYLPLPYNELVRRVEFVDYATGWAITHSGKILKSTDGGGTWEIQFEMPGINLRDIFFINVQEGWVVGHEATILHTTDGGLTWAEQELENYQGRDLPRLSGIAGSRSGALVLVGEFGTIAISKDAGELWQIVSPENLTATFTDIAFIDDDRAIATALGGIIARIEFSAPAADVDPANDAHASGPLVEVEVVKLEQAGHLFSVEAVTHDDALVAGVGDIFQIDWSGDIKPLECAESEGPNTWYGGIARRPETSSFVAVGGAGAVIDFESPAGTCARLVRW